MGTFLLSVLSAIFATFAIQAFNFAIAREAPLTSCTPPETHNRHNESPAEYSTAPHTATP
jgi:hypothetical protein